MDLRTYFQKIRDVESQIGDPYTIVVSVETGDGGRAGTTTEVSRAVAAKMIVDGSARLATAKEKQAFQSQRFIEQPAAK
ncbi:MAG: hypothetical protein JO336_13440 [Acidobacteriia bacterium]|nr:hypothetical protein [Terriglobia bacterium]MBV8902236.1 hypothetical protein [Terriglobia bacterium]MBV9743677.1 hypothetical protein [Terriglobia bacterium]